MWTATKSTKCCATCANWGGDRKQKFWLACVNFEMPGRYLNGDDTQM